MSVLTEKQRYLIRVIARTIERMNDVDGGEEKADTILMSVSCDFVNSLCARAQVKGMKARPITKKIRAKANEM